jgi:hypothetical protein
VKTRGEGRLQHMERKLWDVDKAGRRFPDAVTRPIKNWMLLSRQLDSVCPVAGLYT